MSAETRPILVVGGGIGGAATALALSLKGRAVCVLEQRDFTEIGAGIQLAPNAFRVLEQLGLTEAIHAVASFPDNLITMDGVSGEEIARTATGPEFRARFSYPFAMIHRADLLSVIVDACRKSPLVTLVPSRKIVDVEDRGDHVVARADDGVAYEGAALVGADGLWSVVREKIVGDGRPAVSGHIAYRTMLPMSAAPPARRTNEVVLWLGPKTHLVHYPVRAGALFNMVAVFHSDRYHEGWDTYGDVDELRERFAGTRDEVQELLALVDSWRMWVLCDRPPVDNWTAGRMTLVGDAAHPMMQYLGQGAAMAMEDALCLSKMVDANGDRYADAFRAYNDKRRARTARVQKSARQYGEMYHAEGEARERRNAALRGRRPEEFHERRAWLYDVCE